eukprot:scaffold9331_cov54-Cylindrotheca_fusiformis.AAC.1
MNHRGCSRRHKEEKGQPLGERYLFWGVSLQWYNVEFASQGFLMPQATIVKRSGNGTLHIKANREWVDEPMPTDL